MRTPASGRPSRTEGDTPLICVEDSRERGFGADCVVNATGASPGITELDDPLIGDLRQAGLCPHRHGGVDVDFGTGRLTGLAGRRRRRRDQHGEQRRDPAVTPPAGPPKSGAADGTLGRTLTIVLTLACAVTLSNIYIDQPVLTDMASSFGVSEGAMGSVPTATQFGYALGILLLVPLGDTRDRRKLILSLGTATTVALAAAALSPDLAVLTAVSFLLGALTPIPQIVVPLAVALTGGQAKGRVVGVLQGGLLVGLPASRAYAGALADLVGWRWVYGCSVALMLLAAPILGTTRDARPAGDAPAGTTTEEPASRAR
ncbi:MFS transporter [Streptomyces abikoensis]